jgi:DNA gyrase subunit A
MGVININLTDLQEDYMIKYMRSVLEDRAIADVRDGMKPIQRYCVWDEYNNGCLPDKPHVKCAMTVGSVIGKWSPHGDASAYGALTRLAQNFSINIPIIDGHGNMGSINGDCPGAYRYCESRLSKYGLSLCDDINNNAVDFVPNYSNMFQEPTVLPAKVCNLLIQGSLGIASGFVSSIPPHNINDVCNATIKLVKEPDTDENYFARTLKPDFPTGGIICNTSEIQNAYKTGKGNIKIRSHVEIKTHKNGSSSIIIKDIPYLVTIGPRIVPGASSNDDGGLINSIVNKIKDSTIDGISDIQDHSTGMDINIEIKIKKDYDPNVILAQLYKYTKMEFSYKIQLVCLNDKKYSYYSIKKILEEFIEFRKKTIKRVVVYNINKLKRRIHIIDGLIMALNVIDDVIKIIKKSKDKNIARDSLKKKLPKLTLFQIDAILDMKLSSLTNLEINKLVDEKNEKENKVKELIEDLKEENICKRIIDEQNEYKKKYGYPLRTEYQDIDTNITTEDIIEKEDCVLVLTNDNYIKRLSADKFKTQKRNTQGNNITNSVKDIFSTNTKDHLLCFTNLGRVFDIKVYNINEGSIKSKGMRIPLNLKPDEKVIKFLCLSDEKISDPNSYLMFVTKNGLGKRTSLEEFKNINKAGIIAIDLKENDKIVFVGYIDNNKDIQDIIIATENGLTVRYDKEQFKPIGRTTQGNVVMKLLDDDHIASACIIDDENDKIFFITQNGLGKTTLVTDNVKKKDPNTKKEVIINDGFPRLKRSATIKGRIGITLKNDKLVEIIPIHNNDDIKDIIITTKQKVLTISTEEFLEPLKRATMGKKLINIKDENDFIVNIALR